MRPTTTEWEVIIPTSGVSFPCTLPHTDRWRCHSTVSSVKFRVSQFIDGGPIVHMRRKFHPTSVLTDAFQHYFCTITRNKHYNQHTAVQVLVFLFGIFKDFLHQSTWKQYDKGHKHQHIMSTWLLFCVRTRKIQVTYTCLHQDSKSILLLGKHKLQQNLHLLAYQKKNSLQPATEDTMKVIIKMK